MPLNQEQQELLACLAVAGMTYDDDLLNTVPLDIFQAAMAVSQKFTRRPPSEFNVTNETNQALREVFDLPRLTDDFARLKGRRE